MDLEANALVGHNVVGDMKILDRFDILNEFISIGIIDTQVLVEDIEVNVYQKGFQLKYELYEKAYSPTKK